MPKAHAIGGPTYAGHVDVSSPDTTGPEWVLLVEAVEDEAAPEAPPVEDKPGRRTQQRKSSRSA